MKVKRTATDTLIAALRILAADIQSADGAANAAIAEAADRLERYHAAMLSIRAKGDRPSGLTHPYLDGLADGYRGCAKIASDALGEELP